MDTVTHALIGASLSYALYGKSLGRRAAAIGTLAGVLPDSDSLISSKADPLLYVEFHRFFTHSLLFAAIGAFIATLPWVLRARFRNQWPSFWLCALPAYVSHCLLDASTTYGTQIYWPFSRERVGWDFISIIDPVFTLPVALFLAVSLIKGRQWIARVAIIFSVLYLFTGALQRSRAADAQRRVAELRGHHPERSEIMPTIGNNLVWRSLYRANNIIYSDRIRVAWFSPASVRVGTSLPVATSASLSSTELEVDEATNAFHRFAWFSDGWLARSPEEQNLLGDMRYSVSTRAFDPVWGIRLLLEGGQPKVEWVNRSKQRKPQLGELWSEVKGVHPEYQPIYVLIQADQ